MNQSPLAAAIAFHAGFVPIARTVVTTWGLMAVLTLGCWLATRAFQVVAGSWQAVIETVVLGIEEQIQALLNRDAARSCRCWELFLSSWWLRICPGSFRASRRRPRR